MWQIDYQTLQLVASHRGSLPVLLTCPHGGDGTPDGVIPRTGQTTPAGCDFELARDLHTREITEAVAQRMLDVFGEAPYVVIAGFHRKFLDVNRTPDCAFEVDAAQPFYDAYHTSVRNFIDEIRAQNDGLGLMFDLHGTLGLAADPADVYLGTAGGQSVARLLADDPQALTRQRSMPGFLRAAGHRVSIPAEGPLGGGFTIRRYGSSNADGIDAFQLEIAAPLRKHPGQRGAVIGDLAFAFGNLASLRPCSRIAPG